LRLPQSASPTHLAARSGNRQPPRLHKISSLQTIEFSLPQASFVTLKVYNALGAEVATLVAEKREAGKYSVVWNDSGLPSGVYFYRLRGEGYVLTKKLLLMK
jgi:hypothetical protein